MTPIPSRTFQIVRIESCVIEKAATLLVDAYWLSVATSSACVWPTPPGVIAKIPESMCDEATRKTVNAVTGRWKADMKTMVTPMRQTYDTADGAAKSRELGRTDLTLARQY